jgi:HPt (histidine-containing phosphotransfer) domain-containing protein
MDGYVTKPIDPVELFQTIRTFLAPDRVIAPLTNTATVAENAVPAAESQSPPIDLESLQKRCMGNRKLAAKALSRFNGNLTSDIQSLIQNVQNGDAKAAAAAAHKIKGAAANLSADHVRDISARLESLAMNDELAQAQTYLDQLEVEMNRFRDYLGKALNILLEPESSADQTVPTAAAPPRADDAGART